MDDPEQTKRGLREVYARVLNLDFDLLILAHGELVVGGGQDRRCGRSASRLTKLNYLPRNNPKMTNGRGR
jgi:hypothetical protein